MPRVLLLLPTTTYRTKAFVEAGLKLGVDVTAASERPSTLENSVPSALLTLDFADPEHAARQALRFARENPIDAVIPVDDDTAVVASHVTLALGLTGNPPSAADAAKNKLVMRESLRRAGLRVPDYWRFTLEDDPAEVARRVVYPCVVKPVFLSTSRGVIRANNETEFAAAVRRLHAILDLPRIAGRGGALAREALAEEFIPGVEVALEGLLTEGNLQVLAIFDKPDPLDGPFFEETIYVTPSRLSVAVQTKLVEETIAAIRAMGLVRGPIHAELRVNERGPWVIEVAARAIGGLCSRALRFGFDASLEELIIRHALGEDVTSIDREAAAAGVMMIPIPRGGRLRAVRWLEQAKAVDHVEDIVISAHIGQEIIPPPEGASYLGFIFARAAGADEVESALRDAHRRLEFEIEPL